MTTDTNVRMNDTYIDSLSRSISGVRAAGNVPSLVKTVINGEMWRYRIVKQTKQAAGFDTFRQFVEAPAPEGLGTTPDTLVAICRFAGDTEAAQAVAQAAGIPIGDHNAKDIIDSLSLALREALTWNYIESAQPPYRVPCAIQGDLWRWCTTSSKQEAHDIICAAIDAAGKAG